MTSQDIQYLIDHGLEDDRVKLSVITEVANVMPLLDISLSEPELLKYSPSVIESQAAFERYFETAIMGLENGTVVPFVIFDKQTKAYAGTSRYANISAVNQRLEIGWTWIGKAFQRTGLNRHNKFLMMKYAFDELGYERVELKADGANAQSRKAMEGIGATYEGSLRSHTLMSEGRRRDTVYYSILKSEWPNIRSSVFANMT